MHIEKAIKLNVPKNGFSETVKDIVLTGEILEKMAVPKTGFMEKLKSFELGGDLKAGRRVVA